MCCVPYCAKAGSSLPLSWCPSQAWELEHSKFLHIVFVMDKVGTPGWGGACLNPYTLLSPTGRSTVTSGHSGLLAASARPLSIGRKVEVKVWHKDPEITSTRAGKELEKQQWQQQQNVKVNKFWNKQKIGQALSLWEFATMQVTSERSFIRTASGTVLFGSGLFLRSDFHSVLFSEPSKDIPLGEFSEIAAVGLELQTATVWLTSKWMGLHVSKA